MENQKAKFRVFLFERGISQAEFSRTTGISEQTLKKFIDTGKTNKSTKTLIALAINSDKYQIKQYLAELDKLVKRK
jgi:DNA-binding XRE family transcriptional regulator